MPWLLGWPYAELDPELRKAFEVALHAGTAAALLVGLREEVAEAVGDLDARRAALVAGSFAPPAVVGLVLERPIERHLGTPASIAAGLLAGSALMAWADRHPQRRGRDDAGLADAVWLGLAQAAALVPGVSRNGATLAAARRRGFARTDASVLSRHAALPIIVGASLLKGGRLARRGVDPALREALALGVLAAFGSTLAATGLVGLLERDRSLLPWVGYRSAVAALVGGRLLVGEGR